MPVVVIVYFDSWESERESNIQQFLFLAVTQLGQCCMQTLITLTHTAVSRIAGM